MQTKNETENGTESIAVHYRSVIMLCSNMSALLSREAAADCQGKATIPHPPQQQQQKQQQAHCLARATRDVREAT